MVAAETWVLAAAPQGGIVLIGSRRLSWFPSSLQRGARELDSFRLSRERVQPVLDGRLTDSHLETVQSFVPFQLVLTRFLFFV